MSRNYCNTRPKTHRVYSIEDIMALYGVCRNTVTNWIAQGLTPSDDGRPKLFKGAELIRFHKKRYLKTRFTLGLGEFYCPSCRCAVLPVAASIERFAASKGAINASATCSECSGSIFQETW